MDIYKQKYEQALSQAEKELKCCGSLDCDAARQIFRLFPELKESEDERMRKGLINTFSVYYKDEPDGEWDGKPVKDIIAWLEKQGEQKPINSQFTPEQSSVLDKHIDKFLEQKPAWSEKEKVRIDRIINVLDWAEEKGRISYSDWEDYVCYVKSLRPQSTWKPSDEQMEVLNWCKPLWKEPKTKAVLESLIEDLKKLKGE